jgi:hypothetical protein
MPRRERLRGDKEKGDGPPSISSHTHTHVQLLLTTRGGSSSSGEEDAFTTMAQVKTGRKDTSRQITPEKARSGECLSMHASSFL